MRHTPLFLMLVLLGWGSAACAAENRPNIVLVFADDQSYQSAPWHGNRQAKTPNMRQLASRGVVFDNHYNNTAICMASRASILTGLYEYKTGCNFAHGPMRPETFAKSFPVLLRQSGYRTGFAGKFGFAVTDRLGEGVGSYDVLPVDAFDSWAGGTGQTHYQTAKNKYLARYADRYPHATRAYGAFAQDFIRQSRDDPRPFCLSLFFKAPHRPFTPDPFFDSVYKDVEFETPSNYGRQAGEHLARQSRLGRQFLSFFTDMGFDPDHYQETMRRYHQLIHGVDYAVGMVRQTLREQGLADNTVIILTSDNGFFCGAHGFGGKVLPYEEGSRGPLVIYDPRRGKQTGRRAATVTGTVDIAPTILRMAGVPVPKQMDGRDLSPVVADPSVRLRQSMPLFQVWGAPTTFSMSIVTEQSKYIYWCYGDQMAPAEELFDLRNDPLEMKNVAADSAYQETLRAMRRHYDRENRRWKDQAVPRHHYPAFGDLLDRHQPWEQKKHLVPEHMWPMYTKLNQPLGLNRDQMFDYRTVLESLDDLTE